MASLELDSLTKRFDAGTTALDGFSLSVNDGEFMVVVGPSGSGKTTLLRLVAGLDTPSAGAISIGGRAVQGVLPNERDIAIVFQHPALYPHMTVLANIAFPLKMRKVARAECAARARQAAAMLGIDDLVGRMPSTLSGGQAQRVMLAKAMVRSPSLCLLDEPVSSLDPALRASARQELRQLQRKLRTTTVYVTHDQSEAMTLGDRIAVICGGRLQQVATPMEVYEKPANRFVASFFGSPAMNFLDGRVIAGSDTAVFSLSTGGRFALPHLTTEALECDASLGIRPEALSLAHNGDQTIVLDVAVMSIENLGDRVLLYGAMRGGESVVASLDPRTSRPIPTVGSVTALYATSRDAHLFAPGPFGNRLVS
jgi:ABC-type sugar transport system ATPase subunit